MSLVPQARELLVPPHPRHAGQGHRGPEIDPQHHQGYCTTFFNTSVADPPLFWVAPLPAPETQGPQADTGSRQKRAALGGSGSRHWQLESPAKVWLRLSAPTEQKIGSGSATL